MHNSLHACLPQQLTSAVSRKRGGGNSHTGLQDYGNNATQTAIALESNFYLLLINRILVAMDQKCWYRVIIGINHDWVCPADINSQMYCLALLCFLGCRRPRERTDNTCDNSAAGCRGIAARQHTRPLIPTTNTQPWLILEGMKFPWRNDE